MTKPVPKTVSNRLSVYMRRLEQLSAEGVQTISSRALADSLGLTDTQVRRDLGYFGTFGRPGVGYPVAELIRQVRTILGTDRVWPVALVGFGNLGRALMAYPELPKRAFRISAVFDSDPVKIGRRAGSIVVEDAANLMREVQRLRIPLAILAVPAAAAQEAAAQLVQAGILGLLNFAPVRLDVPADVIVNNVDFTICLEHVSFQVKQSAPRA